jgi:hypothetical protein
VTAPVAIAGADLRHISRWARRASMGGVLIRGPLLDALDAADAGAAEVELDAESCEQLLDLDVNSHGYGTFRALRSDRTDCVHCAAVGRVLERQIARLAVRRAVAREARS